MNKWGWSRGANGVSCGGAKMFETEKKLSTLRALFFAMAGSPISVTTTQPFVERDKVETLLRQRLGLKPSTFIQDVRLQFDALTTTPPEATYLCRS